MRGLEVFTVNVTSFSSHVCIQFEEQAEVREVWNRPFIGQDYFFYIVRC